jgi:adenosylhomocysteine nucleosidase
MEQKPRASIVVIVSARTEWEITRALLPGVSSEHSPLGEWLSVALEIAGQREAVIFFHGGWGKIAAAASAQYVIDHWQPRLLVNLGTCGGIAGEIERGTIVLVERTLVYDIIEQMTDPMAAIAHYTTELDLSWLGEDYPHPVRRCLLVSGDRDLLAEEVPLLQARYGAVAGDWESAAIAYVAARNQTRCLILRGVSDLVGPAGGQAYDGHFAVFVEETQQIMRALIEALPAWLARLPASS